MKKLSYFSRLAAVTAIAAGFAVHNDAEAVDLKKTAPADSVFFACVEDFPSYKAVYPQEAFEGAMLLQARTLENSPMELQAMQAAFQKAYSLSEWFSGQIVLSAKLSEGKPVGQLVAEFSSDLETLQSKLAEIEGMGEPQQSEAIEGIQFFTIPSEEGTPVFYAVDGGLLFVTTGLDQARQTVSAVNGGSEASAIDASAIYNKAVANSAGYDGAMILIQLTDEVWSAMDAQLGEQAAALEMAGFRNAEGLFVAYGRGESVLHSAVGGYLYKDGDGGLNLYRKPEGELALPTWVSDGNYLAFSFAIDLPFFKDGVLALMEKMTPGSSANYQQANMMAAMMIGTTIDDLLANGLGGQITVSMDMDMSVFETMFEAQGGTPPEMVGNPVKEMTLNIAVKNRQILEGVVDAIVAQSNGMVAKTDLDGVSYLVSPAPVPNMAPGTVMAMALDDANLFIHMGPEESLKAALGKVAGELQGAFASDVVGRVFEPKRAEALAAGKINYGPIFEAMRSAYMNRDGESLSEEDLAKVNNYFEFVEGLAENVGVVISQANGAIVFGMGMGK